MKKDKVTELLRRHKLKVTPVRVAIIAHMMKNRKPMTAESLFERMLRGDRATVYRNLRTLEESGLVKRVDVRSSAIHYECTFLPHHHHAICTSCGMVEDLQKCKLGSILEETEQTLKNFSIIKDHAFEIFGTCKKCI